MAQSQNPDPCKSTGNAPTPQQYAALGQQSQQRQQFYNSIDDGSGGAASAGLILGLADLASFHRGGSLDAQAAGSSTPYANYVYGVYMAADGWSLSGTLGGANAYAFLFSSYPANTRMDPNHPSTPAGNVTNISAGFNAQQSGSTCTKH